MHDAEKVLFEFSFRLVVDDDVVEHVKKLGGRNAKTDFFGEFANDRFDMAFAMVDTSSRKVEFSGKRSTGFPYENDASVGHRYDGVGSGADREGRGHGKRVTK